MDYHLLKLGTRGSPLALWQAERVKTLLETKHKNLKVELIIIHTTGDKILDKPLVQVGDKGIFTKEIENALLANEIDLAVHSFKDLPTVLPEGLGIVSIPERSAPFDAILSRNSSSLKELPDNPVIATGSLRRLAQILIARPDATVVDIRGNVNTRLRKFEESTWDALIMAHAGILRMGWEDKIAGVLSLDEMIPAPAQGALAIEARLDDAATRFFLESIHNPNIATGILAERACLAVMEGGCQVPMGAYAQVQNNKITLYGFVSNLDGTHYFRETIEDNPSHPEETGQRLAEQILAAGGDNIIAELKKDITLR